MCDSDLSGPCGSVEKPIVINSVGKETALCPGIVVVWEADTILLHILWLVVAIPSVILKGISFPLITIVQFL